MKKLRRPPAWPRINRLRINPQPFPGAYPTRWIVKVLFHKSVRGRIKVARVWRYFGKPNKGVADYLRWLWQEGGEHFIKFVEMDRGGAIWTSESLASPDLRVQDWSESLAHYYYPWDWSGARMLTLWHAPVFRFRIITKRHTGVVYSSIVPNADSQRLHRKWLANQKFELKS